MPLRPASDGSDSLVLLLHAYAHDAKRMAAVVSTVREHWPQARCVCPELHTMLWSTADPNRIVADVLRLVDEEVARAETEGRPFRDIVLIGHSMGALLARKLYVVACGETPDAPFESPLRRMAGDDAETRVPPRPWARLVSRVVLLAGINRGWRLTHHVSLTRAPLWVLGVAAGHAVRLVSGRTLTILTIRQGAEFITHLRIQWIRMRQSHRRCGGDAPGGAMTIQLLGSRDDMVAPEDNVDLVSGGDFYYLDVPFSGHADVIDMDDPLHGAGRREVFRLALVGEAGDLHRENMVPANEGFSGPDEKIRNVFFVIHGIRDAGYWTHKVARRVRKRAGDKAGEWATETSSYGYFPMLPFLFTWYRRNKVEWLMDRYAEALARYPNARFHYVGHSNGTYLLAKAMELYACCRFENVAFAGSVVSENYDWSALLDAEPPRVAAVLNFVASSDWVVAFFPKGFQVLHWQDLGGAGHDGFSVMRKDGAFYQVGYVKGGHGAALDERIWDAIADFMLTGRPGTGKIPNVVEKQSRLVSLLGRFPPVVWLVIVAMLCLIWQGIDHVIGTTFEEPSRRGFVTGVSATLYGLVLWLAVTRI